MIYWFTGQPDYYEVLGPNACRLIEENYAWFFNDFGYKL